jgi:hypothetical protein
MRQFVFVVEKLAPAVADIEAVLGIQSCYQDLGVGSFGLENALLPINGNLIEVVAPIEDGTTAGRYLERRGGDGGYMIILQCANAIAERERITAAGIRQIWENDSEIVNATHFHPADVPGAILSIDTMYPGSNYHREASFWKWSGPDWQEYIKTDVVQAITAIEIQAGDPAEVAQIWGKVLDRPVTMGARGREVALDNNTLRFVDLRDDRGTGISAIDVLPQNRQHIQETAAARGLTDGNGQIMLCGVRVNLI